MQDIQACKEKNVEIQSTQKIIDKGVKDTTLRCSFGFMMMHHVLIFYHEFFF